MAEREFQLRSDAFRNGDYIPSVHSHGSEDRSPPLRWDPPPEESRSLALRVVDIDAPKVPFTHWILFDIPPDVQELREGDPGAGTPGRNDFEFPGWGGPDPPPRHGDHRLVFTLFALDVESLGLAPGARLDELEAAIEGHVLDQAELMGRYRRD